MISVEEAATKAKKRFAARLADPREVTGAPYGIPKLDKLTMGVQSKELCFLVGDSGMGKSSIASQFAVSIAEWLQANRPGWEVRIVTLEMPADEWLNRMACARAGIPLSRVRDGFAYQQRKGVSKEFLLQQKERYDEAADFIKGLPLRFIDSTTVETLEDIRRQVSEPVDGTRCAWWVLDHLQLVPGGDGDAIVLGRTVNYITRICREVASGMVLTQINNEVLNREDKRPRATDTFGTKKPKQNADLMLGLYREDRYVHWPEDRKDEPRPSELLILKSRYGDEGMIKLWLLKDRMLWVEREEKEKGKK